MFTYTNAGINTSGSFGLITRLADTTFDDFNAWDGFPREQHGRRWRSSAKSSLDTVPTLGEPTVEAYDHGGEVVFTGHADADYIAQVAVNLNTKHDGALYFRYLDPSNWYRARLISDGTVKLERMLLGRLTTVATSTYTTATWRDLKVKCAGSSIKVWVEGTLKINATNSAIPWGAVGLSGWQAKFRSLKAGYDTECDQGGSTMADDDIDDVGDDIVVDEDFGSTSVTISHDHAGNMIDDGTFRYVYDAWNRLVTVKSSEDSGATTFQTAE